MNKTLSLVRGAVSTKDLVPVLTHFHIYDGRVQGGNGRVTIDAPCSELSGFDCTVPAERFLKAVDACDGEPKLKLTDGGKLTISKSKFRATLPLANHESFPRLEQVSESGGGAFIQMKPLLAMLRKLSAFVGEDASRPWSCGILFRDGFAWATNNVSLARVPYTSPREFVMPGFAIDELLRMGHEPVTMMLEENSMTFSFNGDWWLRVQKLHGEWPDVSKFISDDLPAAGVDSGPLAEAVRKVLPFCPNPKIPVVQTGSEGVSTLDGEMSATCGLYELPETRFRAEPLLTVLESARYIDLSTFPGACYWRGENIDGVLVGLRT